MTGPDVPQPDIAQPDRTEPSHAGAEGPTPSAGEVALHLPTDWLDLLADGPSPAADTAARTRFFDLAAATYPNLDRVDVEAAVDALMTWRSMILDHGVVSHGIVNCPYDTDEDDDPRNGTDSDPKTNQANERPHEEARWASWHVLTAVVQMPRPPAEADLGEVLARLVGAALDPDSSYVESFTTEIGCGAGLLLQPAFRSALDAANQVAQGATSVVAEIGVGDTETGPPLRYGLATALAFAPGGGPGLLVTGICMDPTQLLELAGLVAMIAGRSRIGPPPDRNEAR